METTAAFWYFSLPYMTGVFCVFDPLIIPQTRGSPVG